MSVHSTTAPRRTVSATNQAAVAVMVPDADARWAAWLARGIANDNAARSHFWLLVSCAAVVAALVYALVGR